MKKSGITALAAFVACGVVHAAVVVDFNAAAGPATQVGKITVNIDVATDGSASLNSISGSVTNPAAVVSGFVSQVPVSPYTMTLYLAGDKNLRQTSGGEVGSGNNYIDSGEYIGFSLDIDTAAAGSTASVLGIGLNCEAGNVGAATGTVAGAVGGSFAFGFDATDIMVDTTGLNNSVAQGSGLAASTTLAGDTLRFNLNSVTFDVIPEPASLGLLSAASAVLLFVRRLLKV